MVEQLQYLRNWIGREEEREEVLTPFKVEGFSAVLDRDDPRPLPGDPAPPGIHWMLTRNSVRNSELGGDGHSKRGNFLPPTDLPRRMWAGGALEFQLPLKVGDPVRRKSRVTDIVAKQGRSGKLVFITVEHDFEISAGPALSEQQQLVFREPPRPGATQPVLEEAPGNADWIRTLTPDPVLLFRYSALTFNGHRIHYDRTYCTKHEGYPGLVVHGPLLATLLLDLCRRNRPGLVIRRFEFRAMSPVFDGEPIQIAGRPNCNAADLWIAGAQGQLAMRGSVEWNK